MAPGAEVEQQQLAVRIEIQQRRHVAAHIGHCREGGDDQRQRRGHRLRLAAGLPRRPHRQRILAHRNGDAERGAQVHAHGLHGGIEAGVLSRVAGGGHPVGRQDRLGGIADAGSREISQRLAHRQSGGGRRIEQRYRRPFADCHRLAAVAVEVGRGDGAVRHRHLPGANHRVTHGQPADGAIADRHQEGLVGDGRQAQQPVGRFFQRHLRQHRLGGLMRREIGLGAAHLALHARRLAQQQPQRHVDRPVAEQRVVEHQLARLGGVADRRPGTALARAGGGETRQILRRDRQHVALLRLVAPQLHRRHARVGAGDGAQIELAAAVAVRHQLGQGIRQPPRTDVMNRENRVVLALAPAPVDDFLTTPLHLGVVALDRGEIELGAAGAAAHAGCGAATEAQQHGRPAQHDQLCLRLDRSLGDLIAADVAEAAGEHDRLVIAPHLQPRRPVHALLVGPEKAGQRRAAELVVEARGAQRAGEHDLQRAGQLRRPCRPAFPFAAAARQVQVGDGEAGQPRLGTRAPAGGRLVADLAARTGRRAGPRRNRRRVVVCLHLHQDVELAWLAPVHAVLSVRHEALARGAAHHRGIVVVGRQHRPGVALVRVADHREQRTRLWRAVDHPVGVEDLVPAMLGIGLREHHQLDVGRVASQAGEILQQVVDLVCRERQPQPGIGVHQRAPPLTQHIHLRQRRGFRMFEQQCRLGGIAQHRLGHAIVQQRQHRRLEDRLLGHAGQVVAHAALDPADGLQAAAAGNVGCLARPGRDRAQPRHHQQHGRPGRRRRWRGAVMQQLRQGRLVRRIQRLGIDQVQVRRRDRLESRQQRRQALDELGLAERGQRRAPGNLQHVSVSSSVAAGGRRQLA